MLKNGYWQFELLSISETFKNAPAKYPRAFLYTEYDENDLTYFIYFNTQKILDTLVQLSDYAKKWKSEKEATSQLLKKINANERQLVLLARAIEKPSEVFTIALHKKNFDVVYETARRDLMELVERKYLVMVQRGRKFVFYPSNKVRQLLADEAGGS